MSTNPALDMTGEINVTLQAWRTQVLNRLLIIVAVLVVPPLVFIMVYPAQCGLPAAPIFLPIAVLLIALAAWRRLDMRVRAWGLLLLGYAAAVFAMLRGGLAGDGRVFLMTLPVLALILIGQREGIGMTVLSLATMLIFSGLAQSGWLTQWLVDTRNPLALADWLESGAVVTLTLVTVMVLLALLNRFQIKTLEAEHQAKADLVQSATLLQQRAGELENANRLLAAQADALSAVVEIARQELTEEQSLTDQFVKLLQDRFGLYSTDVYLLDDREEYAVLRAALSKASRPTLEPGRRVPVGSDDPVGRAAAKRFGKPEVIEPGSARGRDQIGWRTVLALTGRQAIIGVLDIQFERDQLPSPGQIDVLGTLADQLAIALENVRLFRRTQASVEAERRAYGESSRQAWNDMLRARPDLGFLSNERGTTLAGDAWLPQMEIALQTGQVTPSADGAGSLAIPVQVRGEVVGVIDAAKPDSQDSWTPEQIAMLQTLSDQLGVALESARLYQDTQRRATQERLVGEITARMRESLDMETVLKTAAEQIRQTLGMDKVVVRLAHSEDK